jgi:alpha-glucosidase
MTGDYAIVGRRGSLSLSCKNGSMRLNRRIQNTQIHEITLALPKGETRTVRAGRFADGAAWELVCEARAGGLWFCLSAPGLSETGLRLRAAPGEGFMGFGEQFSHLDMSGHAFCLCTQEQGIGRGAQPLSFLVNLVSPGSAGNAYTTYAPQPVFITTAGRALCFEQASVYWCDVKKSVPDAVDISVWGDTLSGWLFHGGTPLELIEAHTAVTGRLRSLPDFAYGAILGLRGGRDAVEPVLEKCLAMGAPVTALWVEDWQGRRGKNGGPPLWWRWYPDEALYPDFRNWADGLWQRGIALMGYANPFLSADETNPLYTKGREKGYFIKREDGGEYVSHFFTGKEYTYVYVDLTNPEACEWLKAEMKQGMVENGLRGWMADYAEYGPPTGRVHGGDALRAHCEMPGLWARLNAELVDECGLRGSALCFHRSAGPGSNHHAMAYWAGDQNPVFDKHDGLASSITALITSGISGMSINHTDIGGFTTLVTPVYKLVRKKEVMLRWLEYAAFTPVFRTHDGAYTNPDNYQFYYDGDGYACYVKMARVHAALLWYFKLLETEAVEKGWPMVRALYLHYFTDAECAKIRHQYLLGQDLLVNPVYTTGANMVSAYLPKDQWVSPYDGHVYAGGRGEKLPAPLGRPAVLVRKNGPHGARLLSTLKETLA